MIIATRVWPELPLLVAANRDERLERPSQGPVTWDEGFIAPKDLVAGGTWMGINPQGLFAALTNRYGVPPDPTLRSRGLLVPSVLECDTLDAALERGLSIDGEAFNPFHLVLADGQAAHVIRPIDGALRAEALSAGVHVITERSFNTLPSGREERLAAGLSAWGTGAPPDDAALARLLSQHETPAFDGTCVHLPELGYGTRSASILRVDAQGGVHWRFAPGPPCVSPFETVQGTPR